MNYAVGELGFFKSFWVQNFGSNLAGTTYIRIWFRHCTLQKPSILFEPACKQDSSLIDDAQCFGFLHLDAL